jgi:hypothetical protein
MNKPNWDSIAADGCTHWDKVEEVYCYRDWYMTNHLNRYIKRPVSRTTPTPENKYVRTIIGLCGTAVKVDVYRVQQAYPVTNPPLEHLQKKALCAGLRGHKDTRQDILDIIESGQNALLLHDQLEALK